MEGSGYVRAEDRAKLLSIHINRLEQFQEHFGGYPPDLLVETVETLLDKRLQHASKDVADTYAREVAADLRLGAKQPRFLDRTMGRRIIARLAEEVGVSSIEETENELAVMVIEHENASLTVPERYVKLFAKQPLARIETPLELVDVRNRHAGVLRLDVSRIGAEVVQAMKILSIRDEVEGEDSLDEQFFAPFREVVKDFLTEGGGAKHVFPVAETVYTHHKAKRE